MNKKLTLREREILELIGRGMTSKQIAASLKISLNTVSVHRASIRSKRGIGSNADMMHFAIKTLQSLRDPLTSLANFAANKDPHIIRHERESMTVIEKPYIVIADHDKESLSNHVDALSDFYNIIASETASDAFKAAISEPRTELIIIEMNLTDVDGYKLFAMLKSHQLTKGIPVIFIACPSDEGEEELGLECGAVDFIRKPIRSGVIRARVRTQIENKRLRDEIKLQNKLLTIELDRRMSEITHVQNLSLDALTELAKVRDNETGEHLVRTQEYVRILADWLMSNNHYSDQLDEDSISLMARSAPLHDIGKVGIPDRILLKPGKLTPKEWQIMKLHPVRGYEALQIAELRSPVPIPYLRYAKEIARYHHEKWNGTGYPDGLAGNEIPLSARLMAVADVFDALISKRVYKPAWDINYARESILALSGIDFDPIIVQAFDSVFPEILEVAEKYADQQA